MPVTALPQGAPWPSRRVAAPSAPPPALPDPQSDEERAAIAADDELHLDARRRLELKAAYQTGDKLGYRRGVREAQRQDWWSGFAFGTAFGASVIVVLIKIGQAVA
jgi:hypothetical protein